MLNFNEKTKIFLEECEEPLLQCKSELSKMHDLVKNIKPKHNKESESSESNNPITFENVHRHVITIEDLENGAINNDDVF